VTIGGGETDAQFTIAAAARMRGNATASGAMGIDEFVDRAFDSGMGKRIGHDLPFPPPIRIRLPVLDGAAAAGAEIWTKRCDPFRACRLDAEQLPAVGMTFDGTCLDGLAAKRVRYEQRLPIGEGDAITAMADMIDAELLSHGARR
jgi:hypothetical protein